MVPHGLPILGACHIQKALVDPAFHGVVKNLEKLSSDEWLGTAQPGEEGGLELRGQLTARQGLIPATRGVTPRREAMVAQAMSK
jgi:hypothetical protein